VLVRKAEAVVEAVDAEDDRDAERTEDLDVDAELRDPAHHLGADDVQRGLQREQDQRDDQEDQVVGRVELPAGPELGQGGDVGHHAGVHRRHRDEQRDPVEPADEPAEPPADRVLAVLVERARHRVVAGQLAEYQRDQEHPGDRDPGQPDVGRPAGAQAGHEQGEDADHRRQVGERDREVREQPEHAVELRTVPEVRQPCVVLVQGLGRRLCPVSCIFPSSRSPRGNAPSAECSNVAHAGTGHEDSQAGFS
jgi:hypothetical protein